MSRLKVLTLAASVLALLASLAWASGTNESGASATSSGSKGPVTITIWNWSQNEKDLFNAEAAKFEAAHPAIHVVFQLYAQSQYNQVLPLALQGGQGPDIFWLPPEMTAQEYINHGWIQPIGGYLSADFLKQFDQRLFINGVMKYGGKLYTLPFQNRFVSMNGLMFYNKDVLKMAGLDPAKEVPKTFSQFLVVSRKVTAAGHGKYYANAIPGADASDMERILNGLFTTATPASGNVRYGQVGYDFRTGKFVLDNQNHLQVYNLLKSLIDDGTVTPGWSSMKKEAARALFGENKVAFYFDGIWMPSVWDSMGFKNLSYGVAEVPVPDTGRRTYRYMSLEKGDVYLSAKSKHVAQAMEVYKWLHSKEFQKANFLGAGVFPGNESVSTSDAPWYDKSFLQIANETVRTCPQPVLVHPETAYVQWPVSERVGTLFADALVHNSDAYYVSAAKKWNQEQALQLKRNIEKANAEGHKVSMSDFIFPNWNPLENYKN